MDVTCFECNETITADDEETLGEEFLRHARSRHEWPFPDEGIRNFAAAVQRLTGSTERLETIGAVEVHRVTDDRIDDWLHFFDHEAFAGKPEWATCYCLEPHEKPAREGDPEPAFGTWRERRERMANLLRGGRSFGYLAYVDGKAAAWVNASRRADYALYAQGEGATPADADVIGISCFIVAPPYRRHGLSAALLDRVIADAPGRGAAFIEAYPFIGDDNDDAGNFRGPRSMYDARGFVEVDKRDRDAVVRRPV
jgi:GNAT superfamily N-acetyltransferase